MSGTSGSDVASTKKNLQSSKSREQLSAEIERLRIGGMIEQIGTTVRTAVRVGGFCFVAYMAKEAIAELAGRDTSANILVDFLASVNVSVATAWAAATAGMGYGYYERGLRKRAVHSLTARKAQLELKIDPLRTSSGLSASGDTNPQDEYK